MFPLIAILILLALSRSIASLAIDYEWWKEIGQVETWLNLAVYGTAPVLTAAVAAGMVRIAIGTQTAGSVIRPAAYCGVVGFKPTFGLVPRNGVKLQSETLDTVGVFARTGGIGQHRELLHVGVAMSTALELEVALAERAGRPEQRLRASRDLGPGGHVKGGLDGGHVPNASGSIRVTSPTVSYARSALMISGLPVMMLRTNRRVSRRLSAG